MSKPSHSSVRDSSGTDGVHERFRTLRHLTNHWDRPATPRTYYWYLTFETSPQLRSLVERCRRAIPFPCHDFTPTNDLHLTLDRIAIEGDMTPDQLSSIEASATQACRDVSPFDISIGSLSGTPGALGFSATPGEPIRHLRDTLREATLSVHPEAPTKNSDLHPHVTIAYCNSAGIRAARVIATVENLRALPFVDVTVEKSSLVLLERCRRAYVWHEISRVPISGR
ncbi:2'-5' RNA ligase family protein [Nonomuraea rhizosphaerae]|uniref:2'-5' RNA ligase family protein n=1 Tax=Nonomuraea rhizosphaerae TaxID=2665663 RepID=UPI001C5EDFCA|nr:2'-5' RNA ligase family protein [Nonomuraea rhizosphaerae]